MDESKRRRDKPVLSCSFCRQRKLRCDRESPACAACVKRGKPLECVYSVSEKERKNATDYRPRARGQQQARQRIVRLESLVTEMMEERPDGMPTIPSRSIQERSNAAHISTPGSMLSQAVGTLSTIDQQEEVYTGASHWATILDDIQHIKEELSQDRSPSIDIIPDGPTPGTPTETSTLPRVSLLSSATCLTKDQILAAIPPRNITDRLISHFFNTFELGSYFLDRNTFLSEYSSFLVDTSTASIPWLGLLSSALTVSAFFQEQEAKLSGGNIQALEEKVQLYRKLTIDCLISSDYLRPKRYTIETMALHFAVEQRINTDSDINCWLLVGVIIRIALRMGLHRDPSHWPNILPLAAEQRRRLWIIFYQIDFFTSTQVGLPRIIKDAETDVSLPIHILDRDLTVEQRSMPPPRLQTESSPLLHILQRHAVIKIAAEIYDATEAAAPALDLVYTLGAKLDSVIDTIPTHLRWVPLHENLGDDPMTMLQRIQLDILVCKAVYILHRRSFLNRGSAVANEESNAKCVEAAIAILNHQQRLHEETQPGGLMFSIRHKVTSALSQEFLQATMMLCFALNRSNESHSGEDDSSALRRHGEIVNTLRAANLLWENHTAYSHEARKAASAIQIVLGRDSAKKLSDDSASLFASADGTPQTQFPAAPFDLDYDMTFDPSFDDFGNIATFGNIWDDFMKV